MTTKRTVTNTAKETREDPLGTLALAATMGTSAAIEHQEARGQAELVESETLPSECHSKDTEAALTRAGVVFGNHVGGDTLFRYVKLPPGWKKEPTDHSMWSKLVDEKGRERASIFYKAAFYDRRAFMRATSRFRVQEEYPEPFNVNDRTARAVVLDGETRIHETAWINMPFPPKDLPPHEHRKAWDEFERKKNTEGPAALAAAWLIERRPDWKDSSAYWDVE